MKVLRMVGLLGGLAIILLVAQAFRHSVDKGLSGFNFAPFLTTPAKGFAVVELFTSEGCSSCPPADQLIARIQQENKDQPVYILAFHVDYWNNPGWTDEFSDARYSRRQNQYATWLNLQSVYTPQVVVNGRKEFVGSQESTLRSAISSGLQEVMPARLTISDVRADQGKIDWRYQVLNGGKNLSLLVAVVQRSATTKVRGGENGGRTLSHVQIVRNFLTKSVDDGGSGAGSLSLPQGLDARDEEVIAFLQKNGNGQIIAAVSAKIP